MSDPRIDPEKLKAIKDWAEDLADELHRDDVLPCKNADRLGDCITRQRRYLLEEMRPKKMCTRCLTRWFILRASKAIGEVYSVKTERDQEAAPNFS